ncbi:MAG: hypothetical protein A2445_03205 [Candidatus Jacksonbacteria bacterium RIFOXYC2_FULL_44_29]|nr:MAG: hypothetical protein A2240_01285 [Candidatus Jacksonbacteria bacterium RIFOXYA2_FULL_43_12]OGY75892.1 MAG: hypothetical protein A2295_01135 [Candidatus Jacksonbacteria bacterium RIFOXYB2_FULL_44_15]OGY77665.1 MAG: hypothetical protein A2445_03205 [Candidatus Jacksonbacteria bacterium RIFOXYC2_FULL_44_29]OGY79552.1 MAG: hypothetical protein A2550_02290 [Candidatus Jacksonbacteria bacterium RIFOXYD2_FULL_43_21]HBH46454.1 hypothetical protein [Candidatus Jacksonbacteria bacterium]
MFRKTLFNSKIDIYQKIKNTKNWIMQGCVGIPHLLWHSADPLVFGLEKVATGFGLNFILSFTEDGGDDCKWLVDEDFIMERGRALVTDLNFIRRQVARWRVTEKAFNMIVRQLEGKGITDLAGDYQKFSALYRQEYAAAFFTEYITIASDKIVEEIKKKHPKISDDDLQTLIYPVGETFINQESLASFTIGLKLKLALGSKFSQLTWSQVQSKFPKISEAITQHQKQFYWLASNYKYTQTVTPAQFFRNIKESVIYLKASEIKKKIVELRTLDQEMARKKRKIVRQIKLSKDDLIKLQIIAINGWWHDRRKKANMIGSFWLNQFLRRASRRYGVDFELLQYTLKPEFDQLLTAGKIDQATLKNRVKGCVHFMAKDGADVILFGQDFRYLKQKLLGSRQLSAVNDFRGVIASRGKVQGKVRIVINPNKNAFKEGEILVTSMTRPDFVPLMRKAVAIITDEGGLTSHAAIISRELGIPCLVGTKIATHVLHDGQIVEVNANHGIVKVVKS